MFAAIMKVVIGLMTSVYKITRSGSTLTIGSATDTVSIPGTVTIGSTTQAFVAASCCLAAAGAPPL